MSYKIIPIDGKLALYINGTLHCIAKDMREVDKELRNYSQKF